MPSIYMNYPQDGACPFHRILQPARFCADEVRETTGWDILCGEGLPKGHDIYWLHGLPTLQAVAEMVKHKRRGNKIVWGVDDDWLSIPDWNPANPGEDGMVSYELMLDVADHIVVSTEHLASTFSVKTVHTAPNLLDLKMFPDPKFLCASDGSRYLDKQVEIPVRIVWSGGSTHKEDIKEMEEGVLKILEKYSPNKAVVIYNGMSPPPEAIRRYLHRGLFHQPPVPFAQYSSILNSIKADVYLAPLAPVEFNKSKSNLRVIEGWSLMACPVASAWGEYTTVTDNVDGVLVNEPEHWYDRIESIIEDHEKRLHMAMTGRLKVEAQYDWNNPHCRREWVSTFVDIVNSR